MRHRSWCAENPGHESNERLEFLGDAVLSIVVAEHLYREFPDAAEGAMAKMRAHVVSEGVLAERAAQADLGAALLLGRGEEASGGRDKPSLLCDVIEAVIGAVYVDGGLEPARRVTLDLLGPALDQIDVQPGSHDHKTVLQELSARLQLGRPEYRVDRTGPDHGPRYTATVLVDGVERGAGHGGTKKQAEQAAAGAAHAALLDEAHPTHA